MTFKLNFGIPFSAMGRKVVPTEIRGWKRIEDKRVSVFPHPRSLHFFLFLILWSFSIATEKDDFQTRFWHSFLRNVEKGGSDRDTRSEADRENQLLINYLSQQVDSKRKFDGDVSNLTFL